MPHPVHPPMRRADRLRDVSFCYDLIDRCTHGVVAVTDDDGFPYSLPLSLVRIDDKLYFHGAKAGRKLDLMGRHPQVCVTFVGKDKPAFLPPWEYTTYFESVIAPGTAHEVTDREEQILALRRLCEKMTPDFMPSPAFEEAITHSLNVTAVWRIDLDLAHMTGKSKDEPAD